MEREPSTELTPFNSENAVATPWERGRGVLRDAELYWVTTVRPDGRPHVTPLIGVWWEGALHFTTGATERKARNLAANPHCLLTTGVNTLADGLDVVIEGEAEQVTDPGERASVADAYVAKYGPHFAQARRHLGRPRRHDPRGQGHALPRGTGQGVRVRQGHHLQRDALAVLSRFRQGGPAHGGDSPTTVTGVDRILAASADS